jgi:formylglycine-generating enzyme required for sulfatase activity
MMTIPGTAFVMGRSNSNNEAERPAHKVTVASFEIDRYEVTNLQYEAFIKAAQYITVPEHWVNNTFPSGQAFLPVVNVSWADANAYCASLGKRLPTEAEWELACRGADERLFPWGNNWESSQANTDGISCEQPLQVGTFSPRGDSPYGLSDLSGNVAEWTSSNLRNYPFDASLTEQIGDGTSLRAVRGGSWGDKQQVASCVARAGAPPAEFWADRIGFRCARTKP